MKRLIYAVSVLIALSGNAAADADVVTLRADEWCPYNCAPGSHQPGFAIEIAQRAFEPIGATVDYQTMTWSRALVEVRRGVYDGAVAATKFEAPRLFFGEIDPTSGRR